MLPTEEHMEQSDGTRNGVRELLTGDLGLVVIRALLENGVGYVVSSWLDRPTPIDAAIDEARERVLSPRGVVLRRLRNLSALEPLITSPTGGITGVPPRGAVVFGGRRGLRPALEQFVRVECAGAVIGFTFDDDALRIEDAIVVDPEPTAIGLVRAIDAAFMASLAAGRPALIVIRERALGMRGTIHRRPEASPVATAEADAEARLSGSVSCAEAAEQAGLVSATVGSAAGTTRALVVSGPIRVATERALAQVAERLDAAGCAVRVDDVAIVSSLAVGIVPDSASAIGRLLAAADDACVIAPRADRISELLRNRVGATVSNVVTIDAGSIRGEQIVTHVAAWIRSTLAEDDEASRAVLDELTGSLVAGTGHASGRVPRRGEVLHRAVSPILAAGLSLAQGVIGVPGRIDAAYPTYQTDTGVPLTIVPPAVFALHGAASAAPGTAAGVFVVTGQAGGVAEAAGGAGASIEFVDGGSPRAIGVAIATACRSVRITPHVIVVSEIQRIPAPRTATFGMDPDLVGTDRIATAAVPTSATALVQLGEELVAGPTVIALDVPAAHASLDQVRELSPATWDLRRRDAGTRHGRIAWNLRRRLVRAAAGVDL